MRKLYAFFFLLPSWLFGDFVSLEWLYLMAEQSGMAYATSSSEVLNLPASWNSGFQVGLDLDIVKQDVDTLLEYTQYLTHSSSKREGTHFSPTFNIGTAVNPEASWNMAIRLLNLEIGHTLQWMKKLTLRPHIGLGALWHTQTLHVSYSGPSMDQHLKRWGIGIRSGLDSNWIIGYGFSLFAEQAITAMWSRFRIKREDPTLNTRNDFITIKPVCESTLGLAWEQGTFALRAGWVLYLFMENNQLIRVSREAGEGGLSLMGGSLQVIWGF